MGNEVPVQGTERGSGGARSRAGARYVRSLWDQDSERRGEQGSRAYSDQLPTDHGTKRDYRRIKGCTSSKLSEEFPHLKKKYWGRHFWTRGYFCATVGQMTEEMIKQYLEHHFEPRPNDDFKMEPD